MENAVAIPSPNTDVFTSTDNGFLLPADAKAQLVDGIQRNALGLESSATHKHVAKVWQEQCIPILEFAEMVESQKEGKIDHRKPLSWLHLTDELTFPDGMGFTNHGIISLVTKYTKYPVAALNYHLEHGDIIEVANYINRELETYRTLANEKQAKKKTSKFDGEKQVLIRTRPDGEGNQVVRMVGSDLYGIYGNDELVGMLIDAMKKTPYGGNMNEALASHIHSDMDIMHGNILLPDGMKQYPDSDYGVGISFSNSEIGTNTVRVTPFLFRAICLNGCIWGRSDATYTVNKRHLGNMNHDEFARHIQFVCEVGLSEGRNLLTQMEYSRDAKIGRPTIPSVIAYLTKANGLSVSESRAWYSAFLIEPEWENGFGVINALTRAANGYKGDARWNLQATAGEILTPSLTASKDTVLAKWEKIVDRSRDLSEKEVERYTRIAV